MPAPAHPHFPAAALRKLLLCLAAVLAAAPAAAGGSPERKPQMAASRPGTIDADELTPLFPPALGGWTRAMLEKPLRAPEKAPLPAVRAEYASGTHKAVITVVQGPPGAVAPGERKLHRGPRAGRPGQVVSVALGNGLVVSATSRSADGDALQALLEAIDLGRAEQLRPAAAR